MRDPILFSCSIHVQCCLHKFIISNRIEMITKTTWALNQIEIEISMQVTLFLISLTNNVIRRWTKSNSMLTLCSIRKENDYYQLNLSFLFQAVEDERRVKFSFKFIFISSTNSLRFTFRSLKIDWTKRKGNWNSPVNNTKNFKFVSKK